MQSALLFVVPSHLQEGVATPDYMVLVADGSILNMDLIRYGTLH